MINRRDLLLAGGAAALAGCAAARGPLVAGRETLNIVSTPNPNVFPLLLAMTLDPALAVRLLPVREAGDADALFASGDAHALVAMTYMGARKRVAGAIPSLRLHSVTTWRGFFEVAPEGVSSFRDLRGRTVVVSGPVGSGREGGGDIIFRAAARRQGVESSRDLRVEYMPSAQGMAEVAAGRAMGITLPGPGNTGLVMRSRMAKNPAAAAMMRNRPDRPTQIVPLHSAIDFQRVFSGFRSFPEGQLPLGGLHVSEHIFDRADLRAKLAEVSRAWDLAATRLMSDPARHAPAVASAFGNYFAAVGAGGTPSALIEAAVRAGDLVYRADLALENVGSDLRSWLGELIGRDVDVAFLGSR